MRNRMYGGVRGRKMKVGGNYFIFLLLDCYQQKDSIVLLRNTQIYLVFHSACTIFNSVEDRLRLG